MVKPIGYEKECATTVKSMLDDFSDVMLEDCQMSWLCNPTSPQSLLKVTLSRPLEFYMNMRKAAQPREIDVYIF